MNDPEETKLIRMVNRSGTENSDLQSENKSLSLDALYKIEDIYHRFEAAWKKGTPHKIEDLLENLPVEGRNRLERELRELEVILRDSNGEKAAQEKVTFRSIAGYDILQELGKGGMGIVYKARQSSLNRQVALKMILAGKFAEQEELARFRIEAETVAQLQHTNIVQIFEVGEKDGVPFLSLELVDGESLATKIGSSPQPPIEAAQIVQKLAQAMDHAHERGVIHRDLKPANVLLTKDNIPKITDFGLAKRFDDPGHGQTRTGAIFGTPSYMAPEQAAGSRKVGPACDIYSLGAIFYEMTTGRPPFQGPNVMETLLMVRAMEPVPPRQLQPKISIDLETICLKCLQKEPVKRYATARDLGEDLRRFLANEPITARPIGRVERLTRWVSRNPGMAITGSLALLALGIVVVGSLLLAARENSHALDLEALNEDLAHKTNLANTKENEARREAEKFRTESIERKKELARAEWLIYTGQLAQAQQYWSETNVLAARQMLDACQPDLRGWEYDYLWTLFNQRQEQSLSAHGAAISCIALSRNGKHLASGAGDGMVNIWDLATGKKLLTIRKPQRFDCLAFSPDGYRLVTWGNGIGSVNGTVWDATTGNFLADLPTQTTRVHCVAFTPNGEYIVTGDDRGVIRILASKTTNQAKTKSNDYSDVFKVDNRLTKDDPNDTLRRIRHYKVHTVSLLAGQRYIIDLISKEFDAYLRLEDSAGTLLVEDDDSGDNLNARIVFQAPKDGTYHIIAATFHKELGNYTLTVRHSKGQEPAVTAFKGHQSIIRSLDISFDGQYIASASYESFMKGKPGPLKRTVRVWELQTSRNIATFRGPESYDDREPDGHTVTFSPDGKTIIGWFSNGVSAWDIRTGERTHYTTSNDERINCFAFHPRDKSFVVGKADGTIAVCDYEKNKVLHTLKGHTGPVTSITFSLDGNNVISGDSDATIKIWNLSPSPVFKHDYAIRKVAFHGDAIFSTTTITSFPKTAKLWNLFSGQEIFSLKTQENIGQAAFSFDAKRMASFSTIYTSKISGNVRIKTPELFLKIWNVPSGEQICSFKVPKGPKGWPNIGEMVLSPDGAKIIAILDGTLRVWDTSTGQELSGPSIADVHTVAFSPDGNRFVTGHGPLGTVQTSGPGGIGAERLVIVWDAVTLKPLVTIKAHVFGVTCVVFSPDGKYIASGKGDLDNRQTPCEIKVWDAESGAMLFILEGHTKPITCIAFSPDGKRLVSGSNDTTLRVWNVEAGRLAIILKGHTAPVSSVAFSPSGNRLISGDQDRRIIVWEAVNRQPISSRSKR